jgi:head-tail adaptor
VITAAELAAMQATQALTLTTACSIGRRSYTSDGMGGETETVTWAATVCRCTASNNAPDYQIYASRANETMLWRITFAAGTDVQETDKVTIGARSYEVLGVLAPATIETARVCVCMEV